MIDFSISYFANLIKDQGNLQEFDASFMDLHKGECYLFPMMIRDHQNNIVNFTRPFRFLGCYVRNTTKKSFVYLKVHYLDHDITDFIWLNSHVLIRDQKHFEKLTNASQFFKFLKMESNKES